MIAAQPSRQKIKWKTASGGSYQKPLKSFGDLTFETQYCTGFAINLSANSPPVSCSTSEDPLYFSSQDGNFYQFANANPIKYTDPFGLESCEKCPSTPPNAKSSTSVFCFDNSIINLHPGLKCYRAMDGSGRHCCYDTANDLKNGHEDHICPASWKNSNGECIWNPFKVYAHFVFDVFYNWPKWAKPWDYPHR